ncbi:hypothetical protein O0235_10015 [Tepidiforma flava]|uniref:Uncharacterized protein n=1 Tax=Tepidiforma flava TaxID=3004094 RepID=A0ABY7M3D9_9CHLR|nr:hypothetical protein [Tepidiforma flava]WBL35122.1 hypothetical protein O0235_10015 [Tepidiforma flava]
MTSPSARWFAIAVIGGVAAVIVTAVVLLGIGVSDPSPTSLEKNPNPAIPGDILYVDEASCIVLARASGEARGQVHCTGVIPQLLYFLDDRRIAYLVPNPYPNNLVIVDLESGRELERRTIDQSRTMLDFTAPDGTRIFQRDGARLDLIRDGQVTGTIAFDGLDWPPNLVGWSPDSQWLAFAYYPPRGRGAELWLVSRDGRVRGTLATGVVGGAVAWRFPDGRAWPPPPID